MGACLLSVSSQNPQTMQSKMGGVVRSRYSENRVVKGGGREATPFGQAYAHAMEDYSAYCWKNGNSVPGALSEALG